ncbi:sugar transporter ERD6-like 16 [Olea europaea subsp. europaea]|uniref:Sugar transporter ERD6-like 16 n=1 Tax=Olea europaea subsp. europaea TaxID=158383 RepID=A0A8S0QCV4_OLEEU|nr:sugar transporter ERD6-like 16 [Olea europaea subsp. europaea]
MWCVSTAAGSSGRELDPGVGVELGEENNSTEINQNESGDQVVDDVQQNECGTEFTKNEADVYDQIAKQTAGHHMVTRSKIMIVCGSSVACLLAAVVTWRTLGLFGLVPCILLLVELFFIPESPRWLFTGINGILFGSWYLSHFLKDSGLP